MATIQFEKINGGNAYTTYFYKNDDVDLAVANTPVTVFTDAVEDSTEMFTGQTPKSFAIADVRSVEVYLDNADYGTADNNLSNGIAPFKYLGTDAFPTGTDIEAGVVYVRIDGTTVKAQCDTVRNNLIIVVVTD